MGHIATWNGLDWVLIGVLGVSTLRAWLRGVVLALFGLLGFVGGFELASWNFESTGDWLYSNGWLRSLPTARIVAFLAITAIVVVVFELVGRGVKKTTHAVGFGMLDRICGAAFGFVRGLLLGVAVIIAAGAIAPYSRWVQGSELSAYFLGAAHAVSFIVPHSLH